MQVFREIWEIGLFRNALLAGIAVGTICSLLSVIVVLKRMAFIGEGIAHAGFGGMGTALFLELTTGGIGGTWKVDLIVLAFCLATAWVIGRPLAEEEAPTIPAATRSSHEFLMRQQSARA